MTNIEELETLARLATRGPWAVDSESVDKFDGLYVAKGSAGDLQGRILQVFTNCLVTSDEERFVNASFIAATNPATILALVAEVRALRERSRLTQNVVLYADSVCGMLRQGGWPGKAEALEARIKAVIEFDEAQAKEKV